MKSRPLTDRLWARVNKDGPVSAHCPELGPCHVWTGPCNESGYGLIGRGPRGSGLVKVHQLSFELHNGSLPEGQDVCHKCDNRPCCNPTHLFLGTRQQNVDDMMRKGRYGARRRYSGERHHNAKLSDQQVLDMRATRALCRITLKELAGRFGVSTSQAWNVVSGNQRSVIT